MSTTIKAAVIGHPIEHSKSPLIHNHWIKKHGLDGTYEAINITPNDLKSGVQKLIDEGYAGFNITIPHKETIIDLCDTIDGTAELCGAVNTVTIKDGKLEGSSTDSFGFLANIKHHQPDFDFQEGPALVIGAGGAARAIVSGLIGHRVPEILLANRTRERAEKLAEELSLGTDLIDVFDWDERNDAMRYAHMVVNTTSLGMAGEPELDIDLNDLDEESLVTDIVYSPLETGLLKTAKDKGNPTVTGIGMLLHQARPAFQKWFDVMPDVDEELEKLVLS